MSIVLGLDPSLTSTGYVVLDTERARWRDDWPTLGLGRLRSTGKQGDSLAIKASRIESLVDGLYRQVNHVVGFDREVDLVVIESPAFAHANAGTSQLNGLWWAYVGLTYKMGANVVSVAPTSLKKYATGKGNAGKDEVLAAVIRRYPDLPITGNDEADAMVLAAMGARALGEPIEDEPEPGMLDAMKSFPVVA